MKLTILSLLLIVTGSLFGQHNPVTFNVSIKYDTLVFNATIEKGWHLYAVNLPDPSAGPLPTEIVYNEPAPALKGNIVEPKGHTEMDDAFGVEVKYFEKSATFKQKIQRGYSQPISGTVYYMVCNDEMCVPLERPFSINP